MEAGSRLGPQKHPQKAAAPGPGPGEWTIIPPPLPPSWTQTQQRGRRPEDEVTLGALRAAVNLDGHLQFVEKVLAAYQWSPGSRARLTQEVARIRGREHDPRLFLGVVGEFSSGKSTFINALLRDDLLRTDIIQATTSAATILAYGERLAAEVRYLDGRRRPLPGHDRRAFLELLHQVTAREEAAREVAQVTLYHPAEALKDGLVIVDTPGTNVENERHARVTHAALQHLCDAAIVVVPAEAAASQTLLEFLRAHLADVLHRCVFVVTKMDLIRRAREREPLLRNIASRLGRELELPAPRLFPAAPQVVIDALSQPAGSAEEEAHPPGEERQEFLRQFDDTEAALWRTLHGQRFLVQVERLSALLARLLQQLQKALREAERQYGERHEAFEKNRIPDLARFVASRQEQHVQALRACTRDLASEAGHRFAATRKRLLKKIRQAVEGAPSKESLRATVQLHIPALLTDADRRLWEAVAGWTRQAETAATRQVEAFQAEFGRLYHSLALLAEAGSSGEDLPEVLPAGPWEGALSESAAAVSQAGARVNQVPIGEFFDNLFGPSLAQVRSDYWKRLRQKVKDSSRAFEHHAVSRVQEAVRDAEDRLLRAIEDHLRNYASLVDELVAQDQAAADRLARLRRQTLDDLHEMETRGQHLHRVRERLRGLHQA
jgi:GTPase SAR1 family protein